MQKITLNGAWQMKEVTGTTTYPVVVPGTVLSCLLEQKAIPDPYYRKNEYATRDLFWKDYQFERSFQVSQEFLQEDEVELVCYCLDTFAEIYVNDRLLAKTDNMHRTWCFSVKDYIKAGENVVRIIFRSALEYAKNYQSPENKIIHYTSPVTTKGNEFIRKAHSMFGWDWGAQLVDAGIHRDIELISYSSAKIEDVIFEQTHHEKKVQLAVKTKLSRPCDAHEIQVKITDPDGKTFEKTVSTEGKADVEISFEIENPKLWWPNGFGEHPLYKVSVALISIKDKKTEEKNYKIGLRTLTISQDKDEWGSEFAFCINGVKIFTMGANYIPEDCVYPRITREKLEYLVKASVRANYNCLRHWGGGYYPSDDFYDLCDEYGLIVWQDLMFACNVYEFSEAFEKSVVEEIKDNVKRLRHHACLGLWCGNNELETAWVNWTDFEGHSKYLEADYIRQFEHVLPRTVKEMDPQTFYWPSSPSSGGCFDDPNSEDRGDVHYWEVWHGQKPFTDYKNYFFRFCSEFGFQSFPCLKTVETYTEPEDRNIFSDVMESHQKNSSANGKILYYLSENFRYPKDFDSLIYVSQVLQAIAMKYGVEHWRRNRGRCMGALYWQINDEWPVASWSSIDYFGRFKALHYFAKNFYEPITGSVEKDGSVIKAYMENESLKEASYQVEISLKTMDFKVLATKKAEGTIEALSAKECLAVDFEDALQGVDPSEVFAVALYRHQDGRVQREVETFVPYKHLQMKEVTPSVWIEEEVDCYQILVQSDTFANYVQLELSEADGIFSDNYFALTDSEPVTITLKKEDIFRGEVKGKEDLLRQLQVRTLRDSY